MPRYGKKNKKDFEDYIVDNYLCIFWLLEHHNHNVSLRNLIAPILF